MMVDLIYKSLSLHISKETIWNSAADFKDNTGPDQEAYLEISTPRRILMTAVKKLTIFLFCHFFLTVPLVMADDSHRHESCKVCGMYIDKYIRTAAELVYKDGRKEYSCGVACMLRLVEDAGGPSAFESIKVRDWSSDKVIDAETAYYVVGSKVIPDMLPNYIAFETKEEAETFAAKEGGDVISFFQAMEDLSPVGSTAPFRIRTAVTPGKGNFSVGANYGYLTRDEVMMGSNSKDPSDFISSNPSQPKAPKEVQSQQQSLFFNYSPLDSLAMFMNIPYFERSMKTLQRVPGSGGIKDVDADDNGFGDMGIESRYNFWHSTRYSQFTSLLARITLPTGQFNNTRTLDSISGKYLISTAPSLQLGRGMVSLGGGLLYSHRWKDFWVHASAVYDFNPENTDEYKFGDVFTGGVALHYTPNYDLMFGVESDVSYAWKNEDCGTQIGNTGGTRVNLAFVSDWRFINAFGGNFKLRGSVGLPIFEDLNYQQRINPVTRQPFNQVQLGGGFFVNFAITWTTRFNPFTPE